MLLLGFGLQHLRIALVELTQICRPTVKMNPLDDLEPVVNFTFWDFLVQLLELITSSLMGIGALSLGFILLLDLCTAP